ncbi:hypothetical protein BKA65DRAFT_524489 [Rhexocercosporidium sp. MPI-PUGE-AT-0058]|nr:hypothetical protein BKA65DRAFT_524489 [Rhexocercosporidium sp. MPI-PUGE-AT-0058]
MAQITVLITGANRGLGLGLLTHYLSLPSHTIVACLRSPSHPTSHYLTTLPPGPNSHLIILELDASLPADATTAIQSLQETHQINHIDIVIASAGICNSCPKHMDVNFYAVLALYQATRSLLRKSKREGGPMFVPVGSTAGCLANQPAMPNGTYGPSKAALNWLTIRINAEDDWLNAWVMIPGWVKTDMGSAGATILGMDAASTEKIMISVDESCGEMMKVLAEATKKSHGGKLVLYRGTVMGW